MILPEWCGLYLNKRPTYVWLISEQEACIGVVRYLQGGTGEQKKSLIIIVWKRKRRIKTILLVTNGACF